MMLLLRTSLSPHLSPTSVCTVHQCVVDLQLTIPAIEIMNLGLTRSTKIPSMEQSALKALETSWKS